MPKHELAPFSLHTLSSKTDFMNTSIYYIDAYSKLTKAICVLVSAERGKGKGWKTFVINKLERLFVNRQNAPIVQHHHRPDCQIASLFPISYFATLFEKRNLFKKSTLKPGLIRDIRRMIEISPFCNTK